MQYSIAMCTYNGEKYVKEQLESFMSQTVLPSELVVCDDGSTDATLEILHDFAKTASFPVVIMQNETNLGVTKNFEKACLNAKHEIIFFSDQDDIWLENKAEKLLEVFEKKFNVNLIFTDAYIFNENDYLSENLWDKFFDKKKAKLFKRNQFRALVFCSYCTGATMAVRKSLANDAMPFDDQLYHDQWLSLYASTNSSNFAFNEKLIKYRNHDNQSAGLPEKEMFKHRVKADINLKALEKIKNVCERLASQNLLSCKSAKWAKNYFKFYDFRIAIRKKKAFKRATLCFLRLISFQYFKNSRTPIRSFAKDVLNVK